jgi:hypothetical protein
MFRQLFSYCITIVMSYLQNDMGKNKDLLQGLQKLLQDFEESSKGKIKNKGKAFSKAAGGGFVLLLFFIGAIASIKYLSVPISPSPTPSATSAASLPSTRTATVISISTMQTLTLPTQAMILSLSPTSSIPAFFATSQSGPTNPASPTAEPPREMPPAPTTDLRPTRVPPPPPTPDPRPTPCPTDERGNPVCG